MDRRNFIKKSAVLAAAAAVPEIAANAALTEKPEQNTSEPEGGSDAASGKLITSAPMLQNYAETSIGIEFAVSALANGYVLYSDQPDLTGAEKVYCGGYRVADMNDNVIQVRLTGLKKATKYYYRIGAERIDYERHGKMRITDTEEDPRTYSFTTAGKKAKAHFCVINDTHAKYDTIDKVTKKIAELAPSCVIWNGDLSSSRETIEEQKELLLYPDIELKDYASETPYLLCRGNHDDRGRANHHLERIWMYRQPEERSSRDWDLGYNFAVRMGDVAMIGLDTGEDKVDENPRYIHFYKNAEYRKAQALWLKDALQREEIAKAPYIVAFCHIPLWDDDPKANPGDIHPNDTDPRYTNDYASWQRTCYQLWKPYLEKAGCQVVINGHMHRYRFDEPSKDHKWAQVVGGGPTDDPARFPTVIEGEVKDKNLVVTVYNMTTGEVQGQFSFKPRK